MRTRSLAVLASLLLPASLLLILPASHARAQEQQPAATPAAAPAAATADLWLARVGVITDDLSKDAAALTDEERAMLWARLGEAWWKSDEARARAWLRKAVESVESGPESESAQARSRRLDTARRLLAVVAPRERELGKRLVSFLARSSPADDSEGADDGGQRETAEALGRAALAALDTDPRQALALAADSLRAGVSFSVVEVSFRLRRLDPKLSDALFAEGLARAQSSHDPQLFDLLTGIGFPAQTFPGNPLGESPPPPDALRARLLALVAERLLRPAETRQEEERNCAYAWNAARLLSEFARLAPAQSGPVNAAVRRCQATQAPNARQHMEDNINAQEMATADSLLRAAERAADDRLKLSYRMKAAYRFYNEGRPEVALEVLDSFKPSEYEAQKELIDNWRWWFAALAALKRLQESDLYGARKIIDSVPPDLRGFTLIHFLQEMRPAGSRPTTVPAEVRRTIAAEYVGEARRLLARPGIPGEVYYSFLALAQFAAEHAPADAPEILREAAAASNREQRPAVGPTEAAVRSSDEDALLPHPLPAALLDTDETATLQALASVANANRRARMRLGLLASALEAHRRAPKKQTPRDKSTHTPPRPTSRP